MRSVTLALILALGPIGPTLCEFICADAAALHGMADMSSGALHETADRSPGHEHASTVSGTHLTFAGDSACSHSDGAPSILRVERSASCVVRVAAGWVSALSADSQAVALATITSPSASPPLHASPFVPLRI